MPIMTRRSTVIGKSKSTPKGTVIVELPFNRIRRRKNANRGEIEL
jgi:hypothetical protein